MGRRLLVLVLATLGLYAFFATPVSAQCAMCRQALQSPEGQQMMAALRSGIVVLLAAPVAVFVTIAVLAVQRFGRTATDTQ